MDQSKVCCVYEFTNRGGGIDLREYSGGHIHTQADETVGLSLGTPVHHRTLVRKCVPIHNISIAYFYRTVARNYHRKDPCAKS